VTLRDDWEMVVGLEVHTELKTNTKMFCGCANAFGAAPNTNVCPVCLGLPGSLPVLNVRAVELAMAIGTALHSTISPSTFHRKNYFYPDMPRTFRSVSTTCRSTPAVTSTCRRLTGVDRTRPPRRGHRQVDPPGRERSHPRGRSLTRGLQPLRRAPGRDRLGPDIRSSAQARTYAAELRGILIATGASDGRMEEGSMRIDANVSVRHSGDALGTRCEIKNLNSLRSLVRAIDFEPHVRSSC